MEKSFELMVETKYGGTVTNVICFFVAKTN